MKNSSARLGAVKLGVQERQRIAEMKQAAERGPIQEGEAARKEHQETFSGVHASFVKVIDLDGGCAQFRLSLRREEGQPALDEVQALAAAFFGDDSFQILPDPKSVKQVNVMGLFLPLENR
jgi:hypothetical protein